mmetsp:Transcript_52081/g.111486  ORF Transcript_52081/g.111486 Transcript_52081/m.111486 type:complete len:252 (+) Transcript_52081:566-1321(+)
MISAKNTAEPPKLVPNSIIASGRSVHRKSCIANASAGSCCMIMPLHRCAMYIYCCSYKTSYPKRISSTVTNLSRFPRRSRFPILITVSFDRKRLAAPLNGLLASANATTSSSRRKAASRRRRSTSSSSNFTAKASFSLLADIAPLPSSRSLNFSSGILQVVSKLSRHKPRASILPPQQLPRHITPVQKVQLSSQQYRPCEPPRVPKLHHRSFLGLCKSHALQSTATDNANNEIKGHDGQDSILIKLSIAAH